MITLQKQDLYDILYGCTILGTGGGGSLKTGLELIDEALDAGKTFRLVDFSEVPDDAWIATPYMCGSISPVTPELEAQYADLPLVGEPDAYLAYKAMEEYFGKEFYGVISTELGGGNTAISLYVGAWSDKVIIDADPAGRSVPELQHSTYYINDIPIYPLACANAFGDVAILPHVVNDLRAEALVRAMAVASKNRIGVADHPAQARTLRDAVIKGAISNAWKIGKTFRETKQAGGPVAARIAEVGGGGVLFKGRVTAHQYDTIDGFTIGEVLLRGEGPDAGSTYKIMFKNEHMLSWRDGQVDVTIPDLIIVYNEDTNEPNLNPYFSDGMNVTVIGLPAPAEWRTPRGLAAFGPAYIGYDIEYSPIEEKYPDRRGNK
jgi:uncharacterized protein